jgi:hypothetical protein
MLQKEAAAPVAPKDPYSIHISAIKPPNLIRTRDCSVLMQVRGQTPGSLIRQLQDACLAHHHRGSALSKNRAR